MGNQPLSRSRIAKSNQGPLPDLLNVRELDGEWDPQKRPHHSFDSSFSGSAPSMLVYGDLDSIDRLASLRRKLAHSDTSSTSHRVKPVLSPTGSTLRLPSKTALSSSQLSLPSSSVRKRVDFDLEEARLSKVKSPRKPPRKNLPAVYQQQQRTNGCSSSSGRSSFGGSFDATDDLDATRTRSRTEQDLQTSDEGQGKMHPNYAEEYGREERKDEPVAGEWETSRIHQDIDSLFSYLNGWPDVDPEEGCDSGCQSPVVARDVSSMAQAWRTGTTSTMSATGTHSSWPENHMPPLAEDEEDLDEGLGTSGFSSQHQESSSNSDGEPLSPVKVQRPAPKPPLTQVRSNVSSSDEGFLDRVAPDYEENRSSRTNNSTASTVFKERAALLESLLQHRLPPQRQTQSPSQNAPQSNLPKELSSNQPRESNDDYGHTSFVRPESRVSFVRIKSQEKLQKENNVINGGNKLSVSKAGQINRSQSCLAPPRKNEEYGLVKRAVHGLVKKVPVGQSDGTALHEGQIVMARYTMSSLMPGTVSFRRGQAGVLLRRHSNGWSYVALHNGQGWTPTTYWLPLRQVKPQPNGMDCGLIPGCPYYFGDLTRVDCQFLLLTFGQDGDYMLRQSSVREGEQTLSMRHDGNVHHFAVRQVEDEKEKSASSYVIGNLLFHFNSIAAIVQHFEQHTILSQTFAVLKDPFRLRFI